MTGFVRSLLIPIKSPSKNIPAHFKPISPAFSRPPVPSMSFDGVRGLSVRSGGFDESPGQERKPENGPLTHSRNFQVMDERILFRRYQTVWERNVRFPDGKRISFDVLGNERSNFKSVFVFPFDTLENSVTLIREYSPGVNAEQMSFVAGMFEKDKHGSLEEAARAELSEEANLKGGKLIPLTSSSTGISADKYSMLSFNSPPFNGFYERKCGISAVLLKAFLSDPFLQALLLTKKVISHSFILIFVLDR